MKKNILSKLFCLVLALSLVLCLGIVASAETTASGTLNDNISWTLEDGVLTLTGTGATPEYTASPFAAYKADVTSVVVDEGITKLGAYLFYEMTGITQVQLPSTLTHFQNRAFAYCSGLTQITIPESVTYLGPYAFMNSGLTDVYFESATPPSISSAGAPLGGCSYTVHAPCNSTGWTEDTIANWGGSSKTLEIGHRIVDGKCVYCDQYICGENITATFEDGVLTLTGTGATYDYANYSDVNLETYVFYSIKDQVKEIVVGEGITALGKHIFYKMPIEKVALPQSLTKIDTRALGGGSKLTEVVIPGKLTTFGYNCLVGSGATDIYMLGGVPTNISNTPLGGLTYTLHLPCNDTEWTEESLSKLGGTQTVAYDHEFVDGVCEYCGENSCGENISWKFEDGVLTLTGTGATYDYANYSDVNLETYVFYSIKNQVKEIVVGEGITTLGKHIFYKMPIEKVTLPQSLTHIDTRALGGGGKLTEVVIPGKLANFGYNCLVGSGATDVYLLGGVPANISTTPLGGLTYNLHVPCTSNNWTAATLKTLGGTATLVYNHQYAEGYCADCGVAEDGSNLCGDRIVWSFNEETGVLTLTGFGSTYNYELADIKLESYPFLAIKDQVKEIVVGEGITMLGKHIFYQIPVEKVTLPQSLTHIDTRALGGGGKLTEVVIPGTLSNLGYNCLVGSGATDVYILGGVPTNISTTPLGGLTYKLHIPCNDTGWTDEMLAKLGGNCTVVWDHKFEGETCTVCQAEKIYALVENGVEVSYCGSLTEACDSRYTGQMIRLLKDTVEQNAVLSKNLYIDLAGHDLSGVIDCGEEELFILDSTTDEYSYDNCGIFSCVDAEGNAIVPMLHVNTKLANYYHYLAVAVEGGYAFHRFNLEITHISLKPAVTGVGYKAQYVASAAVMEQIASCGYSLQLGDLNAIVRNKAGFSDQLTLRINNFDAANYGHTALKAIPVIVLADGTEIKGEEQSITLYDLMQTINDTADTYDAQQLAAVRDMIGQNPTMQTWGLVQLWSDSEAEAALQAEVAGITDNDALTEYFESYDAQGYVHLTPAGEAYVISPAGTPVVLKNVVHTYVSRITAADFAKMLEIGQTYADNFANLVYGNNYTAINTTTTNEIDCSSFMKLVLSGVTYANSKYATDANTPVEGFGVEFPANPYNSTYGADRYLSNEIAEYAWDNGFAFLPNEDASNIQPGDIVFFATRGEDYNGFFMDITHAAIFVEFAGEQKLYVFQCGDNYGSTTTNLVRYYTIDLNANNAYNDSLVLIARFPV